MEHEVHVFPSLHLPCHASETRRAQRIFNQSQLLVGVLLRFLFQGPKHKNITKYHAECMLKQHLCSTNFSFVCIVCVINIYLLKKVS